MVAFIISFNLIGLDLAKANKKAFEKVTKAKNFASSDLLRQPLWRPLVGDQCFR
ncbi:hypothetical protein F383_15122 [Gossypium arboreum]|uniref:Uncharacterized protein n=1 Tax=Gossypium arboreum TaxID=29729 RepID=A0A0B0NCQ0_GOSAR|nr:hypothetical protein F383_15122 [Gossypium arboreum]